MYSTASVGSKHPPSLRLSSTPFSYKGERCTQVTWVLSAQVIRHLLSHPRVPGSLQLESQHGHAEWGWTASATRDGMEIKATLPPVPRGATSLVPKWSGETGGPFRGFIREKEVSAFLSFGWQLQLEKSYCCRISNVSLPFWSVMHIEHMCLFSCPLFNLDFFSPLRVYSEFRAHEWFNLAFSSIDCLALVYSENNLLSSYPVTA